MMAKVSANTNDKKSQQRKRQQGWSVFFVNISNDFMLLKGNYIIGSESLQKNKDKLTNDEIAKIQTKKKMALQNLSFQKTTFYNGECYCSRQ